VDWDGIEGRWKQFKSKIKEQYGKISDDDLGRMSNRRNRLEGNYGERYGPAESAPAARSTNNITGRAHL
jgi:uncharacterized protein YjbJ (UPF0337 family)